MSDFVIERARHRDAGEILTVQLAAYVGEAQRYADPELPPLMESLAEVEDAITSTHVLVARDAGRLVGSVRGRVTDRTCVVGRLAVAPDWQRRGVAPALLRALEDVVRGEVDAFTLWTGHLSAGPLRLYERLGYREVRRERDTDTVVLVYLEKQLG
ncbi:GNAT family N-acetyltransferase [Actinopolymorpha alba]|uniref:GNAT family N-acetyltransferase n=1 Tax=Actinopolymorpha alba TaxID=533267 RepID=UPI0003678B8D|nr:GNAT family N-acetyltransferase [Actinopolymorpha alba]